MSGATEKQEIVDSGGILESRSDIVRDASSLGAALCLQLKINRLLSEGMNAAQNEEVASVDQLVKGEGQARSTESNPDKSNDFVR